MSPLGILTAGLQFLTSWLMSVLAALTLFISVLVCIAFVERVCDRSSIAEAYTVKLHNGDIESGPTSRTNAA